MRRKTSNRQFDADWQISAVGTIRPYAFIYCALHCAKNSGHYARHSGGPAVRLSRPYCVKTSMSPSNYIFEVGCQGNSRLWESFGSLIWTEMSSDHPICVPERLAACSPLIFQLIHENMSHCRRVYNGPHFCLVFVTYNTYTVSQKVDYFYDNFSKCRPVFTMLSLWNLERISEYGIVEFNVPLDTV